MQHCNDENSYFTVADGKYIFVHCGTDAKLVTEQNEKVEKAFIHIFIMERT